MRIRDVAVGGLAWWLVGSLAGCGDPMLRRGHDALGQGRYLEAVAAYEDVRARLPVEQHPTASLASAHRALAAQALDRGDCGEARSRLAQAEALDETVLLVDHQAVYRCTAAHEADDRAQRIAELERLVALGDGRLEVRHTLMRLLLAEGRDGEAVALVPLLERGYGLTLDDHRLLVGAWERAGRPAAARPHVLKLLQADARDLLARLKLAELDEAGGDVASAGRIYRALTVDHPRNVAVWLRLGQFLERRGEVAEARAVYVHANRLRGVDMSVPAKRPLRKSRR